MVLSKYKKLFLIIIFCSLFIRFISLGAYELFDATEARYAGISFRMAEKNDFLTPWFLPDVPFFGKPPLSFWATALSFKVFGSYHEFFARLPSFLAMLFVMLFSFYVIKKEKGEDFAIFSTSICASLPMFLLLAGCVMTDAFLTLGVTLTNLSFFSALKEDKKSYFGYLFFLGIVVSILSKGIIGVVISGLCCFLYTLVKNRWKDLLRLPLFTGLLFTIILSTPWFYLMEKQNYGFLEYFIIGEHFQRFLVSGWEGDKYGYAHTQPTGTIWVFLIISSLPFSLYLIITKIKKVKISNFTKVRNMDDFLLFNLLSFFSPLLIFTFSKNIIMPYTATAILPFAFIFSYIFVAENEVKIKKFIYIALSLTAPVLMIVATPFLYIHHNSSDKILIEEFNKHKSEGDVLYYTSSPKFSSYFYSRDSIIKKQNISDDVVFYIHDINSKGKNTIICNKDRCLSRNVK